MTFEAGEVRCANCLRPEEEHCLTCWTCANEPIQECCMEGWSEEAKARERRHWANMAALREKTT